MILHLSGESDENIWKPEETHLDGSGGADEEAPGLGAEARGDADDHEHDDALGLEGLAGEPVADGEVGRGAGGLEGHLDQQHADVVRGQPVPPVEVLARQDLHLQRDCAEKKRQKLLFFHVHGFLRWLLAKKCCYWKVYSLFTKTESYYEVGLFFNIHNYFHSPVCRDYWSLLYHNWEEE